MEKSTTHFGPLAGSSKRLARRLLTIGENRLELLAVEMQEERARLWRGFFLALGVAALVLLAGLTLTAALVIGLWAWSPVAVLVTLTGLYGAAGFCLHRRLNEWRQDWSSFSGSLEQLRKDRACLENILA